MPFVGSSSKKEMVLEIFEYVSAAVHCLPGSHVQSSQAAMAMVQERAPSWRTAGPWFLQHHTRQKRKPSRALAHIFFALETALASFTLTCRYSSQAEIRPLCTGHFEKNTNAPLDRLHPDLDGINLWQPQP